jgi:hypothetical protein
MEIVWGILFFVVIMFGLYWLITLLTSLALTLALRFYPHKVQKGMLWLIPK